MSARGDPNLYTYVGNDPLDKTDPSGLKCDVDEKGRATACHIDQVAKGQKLSQSDRKAAEAKYWSTVQKLQSHPSNGTAVRVARLGADGKPTKEYRKETANAGELARNLINRIVVAAPESTDGQAEQETQGETTTILKSEFANMGKDGEIQFAHEGLHGGHVDNVLIGHP